MCRISHSEEMHNFHSSSNVIRIFKSRRMEWAGHLACLGGKRKKYKIVVGKLKRNKILGSRRCR